jgi:hypothetical protein
MSSRKEQILSMVIPGFSLRYAGTQDTKTQHMMEQIAEIIFDLNVLILVDNKNDQQQQMESRLKKFKMDGNLPEDTDILSDSLSHKSLTTEFKKMFGENKRKQIMILKFNSSQIEKLTDAIILGKEENHYSTIRFQIFVDEGDIATKHENTNEIVDGQPKVHASFIKIRKKCEQKDIDCSVQFISATPQNILVNYPIEKIYTHESHPDYIGHKDIHFVPLEQSKSIDMVSQVVPQILYEMTLHGEKGNVLVCTNRIKVEQEKLLRVVTQLNVLTINYNGDGVRIFIPVQYISAFENQKQIYRSQDGKKVSFSRIDSQTFISKDIYIGDVYQMINNMEIQISVTIGKDLMGRGISFCSVSREDSIPFATTRMILDVSNTTHCVSLIQMIGRLLGTVCPNSKRVLYCKKNVYDDYMKATEDVQRNIEMYQNLLESGEIQYTNEIPNYRITKRSRDEDRVNANVKTEIRRERKHANDSERKAFQKVESFLRNKNRTIARCIIEELYSQQSPIKYDTLMENIQYFEELDISIRRKKFDSQIKNGRSQNAEYGFIWKANKQRDEIIMNENIRKHILENNLL